MSDFLTVQQFAAHFNVCTTTVYTAIQQNRVNSMKIIDRVVIPKSEVQRFRRLRRRNGDETKVFRKVIK